MARRGSRLQIVAVALLAALIVGGAVAPRIIAGEIRTRVAAIAARYATEAQVDAVRVGLGTVDLYGLRVDGAGADPLVWASHVRVRIALRALLVGSLHLDRIEVDDAHVLAIQGGPADNVTAVLEAYRNRPKVQNAKPLRIDELKLTRATLEVRDTKRGRAVVDQLDATIRPDDHAEIDVSGAHVVARIGAALDVASMHLSSALTGRHPIGVPIVHVEGAQLTPFTGLRLGAIGGDLAPDPNAPGRAKIDFGGSYGDRTEKLWSAKGWIDPAAQQGRVTIAAERFRLGQLSRVMGGSKQGVVDTQGAEIDAHIELGYASDVFDFDGRVHLSGLTIENARLGPKPVHNVGFDAKAKGRVDLAQKHLQLEALKIDYHGVKASLVADFAKMGRLPSFHAQATIEPIACQRVLDALPSELTPFLQGFRIAGEFSTDLHAALDLADLAAPVDLGGKVGIEGCRVTNAPEWGNAERLKNPFEQTVEYEPGKWMTFVAGPENPDFVPYAEISPHLVNSIMTTEDSGFMKHHGFIPSEFRSALQQNLQRGYFRLGASSITMQMVKNVLLSREKTLSRKLQEMFLTWYLEHHLSKERILEIYFNVIEFGPGIYGIGRAAKHYFGHPAKDLTPRESVFFSSILPNPKRRYVQYCHQNGQVDAKWDTYLKRILRRMHERGRLTDAEFNEAVAAPLTFSRAEATSEKECMALVKRVTGGPPWPTAK